MLSFPDYNAVSKLLDDGNRRFISQLHYAACFSLYTSVFFLVGSSHPRVPSDVSYYGQGGHFVIFLGS